MTPVSVVIPAYNQPRMLEEALRGVERQVEPPREVVVIDDCSDDPLELATSFSSQLPLRFVRNSRNLGPAGSVVRGIRESSCELIAILNHDDVWEPEFLDHLTRALDRYPQACFAFSDHGIMRADGESDERLSHEQSVRYARAGLSPGLLAGAPLYRLALLEKAVASSSFTVMRRHALELPLIETGADMWDYFATVGACRTGQPAAYVAERLGWYRISPTMLSATHADPRKRIAMARPQTAILVVILRSPRLRSIHRAAWKRLGGVVARALAAAIRTRSAGNVAMAVTRVISGAREALRIERAA
jgi:glycosyltransferase involved in cell wall biosynthesis